MHVPSTCCIVTASVEFDFHSVRNADKLCPDKFSHRRERTEEKMEIILSVAVMADQRNVFLVAEQRSDAVVYVVSLHGY